ncbi:MAG: bifunctional metallophosphatase/5'-nucleotidase [Pseudomonadales bacterium]|nr:bifunctional metallophosphatase/5'-nucleotidase [Pseudomonadales bacterium]
MSKNKTMAHLKTIFTLTRLGFILLLSMAFSGCATNKPEKSAKSRYVDLQILAINDFHGSLESGSGEYGGAAYLATHLLRAEAQIQHSMTVSAGDLVGASPFFSSLFHDEPTIEAANIWGLDYHAVGNHEFDEGLQELMRLQNGGSHGVDGDRDGDPFQGAKFRFLAANLFVQKSGARPLVGYAIENFDGIAVGIIGLTLTGTLSVISKQAGRGLGFEDEARAINAVVRQMRNQGVEAIVVLLHEGGKQLGKDFNACEDFSGDVLNVVQKVSPAVDLFITGHTHEYYLCEVDGRPVTSAGSNGTLYTRLMTRLDRESGDLVLTSMKNEPVTHDVKPNRRVLALLDKYRPYVKPLSERPVGKLTASFVRETNEAGESSLGQLIADVQLYATRESAAVISFMNPGGLRRDITFADNGVITFGNIFATLPFNNSLVTMTLTGAQIKRLLEQQWQDENETRILAVSMGFTYTWNSQASRGNRIDSSSIQLNGVSLKPDKSYRITVNNFIAGGGDGFTVLREGYNMAWGMSDLDALQSYLASHSPLAPVVHTRIKRI